MSIDELETAFSEMELVPLKVDVATTINDPKKFIETSIRAFRASIPGSFVRKTHGYQLVRYYRVLKKHHEKNQCP